MSRVLAALFLICQPSMSLGDVQSSKVNAYSVISPANGVSSSKVNAYTVIASPDGVSTSKINVYSIIASPDGLSTSKVNAYSIVAPSDGLNVSKLNGYAIVSAPDGVSVSKAVVYVVVATSTSIQQPNIFIFSRSNEPCEGRQESLQLQADCKSKSSDESPTSNINIANWNYFRGLSFVR